MNTYEERAHEQIVSSLPRPWEQERGFEDALYDWMQRAPWMALSAIAHALLLLVLLAIPWDLITTEEPAVLIANLSTPEELPFEDPPPPEPVVEPDVEPELEPDLQQVDSEDTAEELELSDVEATSDARFDDLFDAEDLGEVSPIGIGGGWRGGPGSKFRNRGKPRPGRGVDAAVDGALRWLADHQAPDGHWSAAGFMHENALERSCACDGPGQAVHDVGITGLALLAFLGDGHTTAEGAYGAQVSRGIRWLREQQDADTGLVGPRTGHGYVYDHAIATVALCEAHYASRNPLLERTAQGAIDYVLRARAPYGAWRYDVPSNGDSDTSVTGWMVLALASAEDGGLRVDRTAFAGALSFLDEMTDPATGRVGYNQPGSLSSRIERVNDHFPPERGEAMTAVGLLSRFFLGQTPRSLGGTNEVMDAHAALLLQSLPSWDPEGAGTDMYCWYYGSYAMYQMGGERNWGTWNRSLEKAVTRTQRKDGDLAGSWDPIGPWGSIGGRVYSTAIMALCLEVHHRYARIVGAR